MKLYFPESALSVDHVGYNHAVSLLITALAGNIVGDPKQADYRVYCNLPWHHKPKDLFKDGLPLLVYTMYESTLVPKSWVKFLNKYAAIVCVPSTWCKENFINSGVERPVFVLSLAVNTDTIKPIPKSKEKDLYIYLWQGVAYDPGGRKGVDVVVRAFKELKQEKRLGDNAKLVLKYKPMPDTEFVLDGVEDTFGITYLQRCMSRKELEDLYADVDCCVNPTHGEGFGLIPLEQMAYGKPVILTDYSMPYLNCGYYIPLLFRLEDSCVTWCHKFIKIGLNGIIYNKGGLPKDFIFMPKLLKPKSNGRNIREIMVTGREEKKVSKIKSILIDIYNFIARLQKAIGFYLKPDRKSYCLYQEYQGLDAFVNIKDLKYKMEWCYKNPDSAAEIGRAAAGFVAANWNLNRIRNDFYIMENQFSRNVINAHKWWSRKFIKK